MVTPLFRNCLKRHPRRPKTNLVIAFRGVYTFLFAFSAYFLAKWISDRASFDLFEALGDRELERPHAEAVEAELKAKGFLDQFGELHEEALSPQEEKEVELIEESVGYFNPPSYSDNRVANIFKKISERKKEEGGRSRNLGIALFVAAAAFLAVSLFL